jgi:hypothetical protein
MSPTDETCRSIAQALNVGEANAVATDDNAVLFTDSEGRKFRLAVVPVEQFAPVTKRPWSQKAHDFDAMSTIAAHLRENPAHPFSGRQCEEFVLDARDRLYGPKTVWRSVAGDPPCEDGEQADVIFCGDGWYWPMWGMVTRWGTLEAWVAKTGSADHWPGKDYQWSIYDPEKDKYLEWDGPEPTMWLPRPGSPQGEQVDIDLTVFEQGRADG